MNFIIIIIIAHSTDSGMLMQNCD